MRFKRISKVGVYMLALAASILFLTSCAKTKVTLRPTEVEVEVNDSGTVTAKVTKKGYPQEGVTVAFESEDEAVATIEPPADVVTNADGEAEATVRGESQGSTTVTATADGASASATVMVEKPPVMIEITGLTSPIRWQLKIDGVDQNVAGNNFEIDINPADTINWKVGASGFLSHGVSFDDGAITEAILEFQPGGQTLSGPATPALVARFGANSLGTFANGTGGFPSNTALKIATVKDVVVPADQRAMDFTCVVHGAGNKTASMNGTLRFVPSAAATTAK